MLVAVDVHKLIALRKKAKLTQCRLSILAELPANAVYRIESQSTFCNKTSKLRLSAIANVLKVNVNDLILKEVR